MKKTIGALLILLLLVPGVIRAESLRLEGLMRDEGSGEGVAVIEGALLREGDMVKGYKVLTIGDSEVLLKNTRTGETESLHPRVEAPAQSGDVTGAPASPPAAETAAKPENFWDKAARFLRDPGALVNRAWELKGVRDLVILNNAAVRYYEAKNSFPPAIGDLIDAGYLAGSYRSGVRTKYRFTLRKALRDEDFGIHADPLDAHSGLNHFFVGTEAIIRFKKDSPAGPESPPYDY